MKPDVRTRTLALTYGLLCHGSFVVAVSVMGYGLFTGMGSGLGPFHGAAALGANALLVLQFPLLHSLFLTRQGRTWLGRLAPSHMGRSLGPTLYATFASAQLLATFLLWSPSGVLLWRPSGALLGLHLAAFAVAWLFLIKALHDAGLGLQTGWIGWTAAWNGTAPRYPGLPETGLFARCRQPIYLGFALILWTSPTWTLDRLLLASAWGLYCVLGPIHKERRFAVIHGQDFDDYRRRVPYFLPKVTP